MNNKVNLAASGKAVAWECRTVNKKTGSVHYDWRRCSQADFDGGNTEGSALRVEFRALYLHPATVTDEDVERALEVFCTTPGRGDEDMHKIMRAALESFANKERE